MLALCGSVALMVELNNHTLVDIVGREISVRDTEHTPNTPSTNIRHHVNSKLYSLRSSRSSMP